MFDVEINSHIAVCATAEAQCAPDGEVGTEPRHLAGNFSNLQSQLVSGGETEHLVKLPKIKFAFFGSVHKRL